MKISMPKQKKAAYLADFVLYRIAVFLSALFLLIQEPQSQATGLFSLFAVDLLLWTALEYFIHCFILHGVPPFQQWHEEHNQGSSSPFVRVKLQEKLKMC
jgi:hypothetical protein